jgi:hypothetical protein
VMLLTVSLVTVMREEAPEIMSAPGGVRPLGDADQMRAGPAADAGARATAAPKTMVPNEQRSDSVGLKPPPQTRSSGIGLRDNRVLPDPASGSRKDRAAAGRLETDAATAPAFAKRALPEAFPGADDTRDNKAGVPEEKLRQSAKAEAPPTPARAAGAPVPAPVPATAPVMAAGTAAEGKVKSKLDSVSADVLREPSRTRAAAAPVVPPSASPPASQMARRAWRSSGSVIPIMNCRHRSRIGPGLDAAVQSHGLAGVERARSFQLGSAPS